VGFRVNGKYIIVESLRVSSNYSLETEEFCRSSNCVKIPSSRKSKNLNKILMESHSYEAFKILKKKIIKIYFSNLMHQFEEH
jgi:hypothetical protein